MKQQIKITESDLHRIVKESVNKVLNEGAYDISVEVDGVFKPFGNNIGRLLKKYSVDEVADRKIGRLIHALQCLVMDSINGRSDTSTWGINTLDI